MTTTKVFVLDYDNTLAHSEVTKDFNNIPNEILIDIATDDGMVFSLTQFQDAVNEGSLSLNCSVFRFIDVDGEPDCMTELEKNVLITKFMGYEIIPSNNRWIIFDINDDIFGLRGSRFDQINYGQYREWSGLIPILNKIDHLLYSSIQDNEDFDDRWMKTTKTRKTLVFDGDHLKFGTDMTEVYDDIVDFINFYNNYIK